MPLEGEVTPAEVVNPQVTTPEPAPAPSEPSPPPSPAVPTGTPAAFNLRQYASQHIPGADQRYQSDEALARELIQAAVQAQQMQPYAHIGQQFAPHMTEFQKWQKEQEAVKAAQAAKTQAAWWSPPEYNPAWEKQIMIDPQTRQLVALPGHDPTIPSKIEAYREFQRETLNKLTRDPIGTLREGLLPMIREEAQRIAQEQAAAVQSQQFAEGYVQQQIGWLAQKDAQGNPIRLPNGGYALTPAGERFNAHVVTLKNMGVHDPRVQAQLAEKILMGELAMLQTKPAAPPVPGQPARPAFQTPNNQPNYGGTDAPVRKSVKEMLRENLSASGHYQQPQPVV